MKSIRNVTFLCATCVAVLAAVVAATGLAADETNAVAAADARILAEIHDHSEVMANLEYLSDAIGPRLTGSPQLKRANEWTAEMFRKYGLVNVHLEAWQIAHAWTRGTAHARIVSPTEHPLTIAAAGWSPSTPGVVRGPLVYFDARSKADFAKYEGKLKGAIVIAQEPQSLSPPPPEERQRVRPMQAPPPRPGEPPVPSPFAAFVQLAQERNDFFKKEGVAVLLRDSAKPHALLNMTGIGGEKFDIGPIPTAFITGEGYRLLYRMQKHGPVEVEVEMTNSFGQGPIDVYNTVAEIRGTEKPDEVVMLGAHLDSWDLGTGSTDNGTGSMAVLEAARALARLDLKPKRTIRFVLFTGEEEGLVGSAKYVEMHKADLDKISAILVHDTGTGRVLTLGLHHNYQAREIVDQVLAPLGGLNLLEPTMAETFGTDHASFDDLGVPGFWGIQEPAEYSKTHHSQSDTFDKVWKDDLVEGAQVLAAWAYNTAQLPQMLPRRPAPVRLPEGAPGPPPPKPDPLAEMDGKIQAQVKTDMPELKAAMQYFSDRLGPRLTGSPRQQEATAWAAEQFKKLGLENVHLEPWTIASGWTRGTATARVVSPVEQTLTIASAGWAPGTNGPRQGELVGLPVAKVEELEKYKGKLKGKIAMLWPPFEIEPPGNPLFTPYDQTSLPVAAYLIDGKRVDRGAIYRLLRDELRFLQEEGIAGLLLPTDKTYGLLNMGSSGREYKPSAFPTAYLTLENHHLLWRLLADGPVTVELNIHNTLTEHPVTVNNTVAEIRGTEKSDEVVILGAHIDSWDLGTGATDNGTGSMAVLEAARALSRLGVKPRRTIRFVLFPGEEQGLNGSRAYVAAHKDELAKISGVLVHDTGTGRVLTIGLMHNYAARETMDRILFPLSRANNLAEPSLRTEGGSDHVPFDEAGVPAFWCIQDSVDYDRTHHSQADTFDRVRLEDLAQGAT
ncbi:MAG TPA: M20/M25/M40 family metallo-hydrolase, partial [Methylomirabilota bacterium]|nr:M20/M25/M40 family metallo-hydrolase [Methylomirabilota bacterium]